MTVAELLKRIIAAYPSYDAKASEVFTPVFYARLRKHEGDVLAEAATEVLGSFRPKYDHRFPIPADFEAHLPSGKLHLPPTENSERQAIEERAKRRARNIQAWISGQGAKIKSARPYPVYCACLQMALAECRRESWRYLSPEQIEECEMRALSTARVHMFGPLPKTNEEWDGQIARVRAAWAQPEQEAA